MYNEEPDYDEEETTEIEPNVEKPAAKGLITFSINMDEYLSSGTLEDKIAHNAATNLIAQIEKSLQKRVLEMVEQHLSDKFQAMAEEKLNDILTKPIQKFTAWGSPDGQPMVLQEIILKRMDDWITEKVRKSDGAPGSGYENKDYMPRLQWIINQIAIAPLNEAIKAKVKDVEAEVRGMVQKSVSAYIAQELTPKMPVVPQITTGI